MLDFWELRKGPKLNFCEKGDPHMRGNCPSYEGQVPHMRGWSLIWGWPETPSIVYQAYSFVAWDVFSNPELRIDADGEQFYIYSQAEQLSLLLLIS